MKNGLWLIVWEMKKINKLIGDMLWTGGFDDLQHLRNVREMFEPL